jgi:hypothetical protein
MEVRGHFVIVLLLAFIIFQTHGLHLPTIHEEDDEESSTNAQSVQCELSC